MQGDWSGRPPLRGLYVLTDDQLLAGQLLPAVEATLLGGCRIVQYRSKLASRQQRLEEAAALRDLCHRHDAWLLVNDDPYLARDVGADGVHLGQEDLPVPEARQVLGSRALIGVTCHASLALAQQAVEAGADYVAFGRFYSSGTKPQAPVAPLSVMEAARQQLACPVVAIGGITLDNALPLKRAGASMLAVVGGVFAGCVADPATITSRARAFQSLYDDLNHPHDTL